MFEVSIFPPEVVRIVYAACEFVARNAYVGCDECVYQRFLEAELNSRFRARFGFNAPSVERETNLTQVFSTSDGTPVMSTSPRADLLVFGHPLTPEVPNLVIEIKATSRVSSHMCFQTHKYGSMMAAGLAPAASRAATAAAAAGRHRPSLLFLVDFVQPDNETIFAGPVTKGLRPASCLRQQRSPPTGPDSTTTSTTTTTTETPAPKRKRSAATAPPKTEEEGATSSSSLHHHHLLTFRTQIAAPIIRDALTSSTPSANLVQVSARAPIHMDCVGSDEGEGEGDDDENYTGWKYGPGLFFLVGEPQNALCTSVVWRRFAHVTPANAATHLRFVAWLRTAHQACAEKRVVCSAAVMKSYWRAFRESTNHDDAELLSFMDCFQDVNSAAGWHRQSQDGSYVFSFA